MIATRIGYLQACEELEHLESRLRRLLEQGSDPEKAAIRKRIARLHEKLAQYETAAEEDEPTE